MLHQPDIFTRSTNPQPEYNCAFTSGRRVVRAIISGMNIRKSTPIIAVLILFAGVVLPTVPVSAAGCSATVTNVSTTDDYTSPVSGSLQWAVSTASSGGTVCFNIPGGGVKSIGLVTSLVISKPVVIDGTTQPGYAGTPLIEIHGANAGVINGIIVNSGNSTLKALAVNRFKADGILIQNGGSNKLVGNFIGTDASGTQDYGNTASGLGILSANNIIGGSSASERNIISGNNGNGLVILGGSATGNQVRGNYIGTNVTGTSAIPNAADGLLIQSASWNTVGGTTGVSPGGNCTGECNLLSGNGANGMGIWLAGANNNYVKGNYIGTNVYGTGALANGDIGLEIQDGASNTVGGTTPQERNLISGNLGAGVSLTSVGSVWNTVSGNYIGVSRGGDYAIPNHKMGVNIGSIDGGSSNANSNVIGGTSGTTPGGACTGACNIIAGNYWSGIYISGYNGGNNEIIGNYIGVGASGGWTIPNHQDGIGILNSPNNRIGGPSDNARNIISGNGTNGIAVIGDSSTGTRIERNYIGIATDRNVIANQTTGVAVGGGVDTAILANSIYGNGFLGIDLSLGGISYNDGGDADSGPNRLQNYPTLAYAIPYGGGTNVAGSLNSNAGTSYRIEFFSSPTCGYGGHGQGYKFLGSTTVKTDAAGNASFNATVSGSAGGGQVVTATATKLGGSTPFETSEFSGCVYTPRQHPDGILITPSGSPNVFMIEDSKVRPIGSPEVLASHGMTPYEFKGATTADTNMSGGPGLYFREGTLIKGSGPDVFAIDQISSSEYVKRKITSVEFFNALGYTPADVITVPDSALGAPNGPDIWDASAHPDGGLVKDSKGTVYLIENGKKRLVGSPGVFVSQRFKVERIKHATAADLALPSIDNVQFREGAILKGSGPALFAVDYEGGVTKNRQLVSVEAMIELGFTNGDIINVPDNEIPAIAGPGI